MALRGTVGSVDPGGDVRLPVADTGSVPVWLGLHVTRAVSPVEREDAGVALLVGDLVTPVLPGHVVGCVAGGTVVVVLEAVGDVGAVAAEVAAVAMAAVEVAAVVTLAVEIGRASCRERV